MRPQEIGISSGQKLNCLKRLHDATGLSELKPSGAMPEFSHSQDSKRTFVYPCWRFNNKELDMNWDAMGAVGEIVGAIAVLVTLIYLAAQIRQNAKALDRQSDIAQAQIQQMRADSVTQLSSVATANPENVALLTRLVNTKGISREELSAEENIRAMMLLTMLRSNVENTFHQFKRGFLSEAFYSEVGVKNNLLVAQLLLDFDFPLTQGFREELLKNLSEIE
jgi:hypothetical protein